MNVLSFDEFLEELIPHVRNGLDAKGSVYGEIKRMETIKPNNASYVGIGITQAINSEMAIMPVFKIDQYYQAYKSVCDDPVKIKEVFEKAGEHMADMYFESCITQLKQQEMFNNIVSKIDNVDFVLGNVFPKFVRSDLNEPSSYDSGVSDDLKYIYKVYVENQGNVMGFHVTQAIMDKLGVDESTVKKAALQNLEQHVLNELDITDIIQDHIAEEFPMLLAPPLQPMFAKIVQDFYNDHKEISPIYKVTTPIYDVTSTIASKIGMLNLCKKLGITNSVAMILLEDALYLCDVNRSSDRMNMLKQLRDALDNAVKDGEAIIGKVYEYDIVTGSVNDVTGTIS